MPSPNTLLIRQSGGKSKIRVIDSTAYDIYIVKQNKQPSHRDLHRVAVKRAK